MVTWIDYLSLDIYKVIINLNLNLNLNYCDEIFC